MQLRKFKEIFEYSRAHSRFYRDVYSKAGVLDLRIRSWDDVKRVPIINKSMLREYDTREIMTCDIDKSINIHSTSGSTGQPFKVAFTKFEDYTSHVRLVKSMMEHGYSPWKKLVLLSRYEPGHEFEVEEDLAKIQKLRAMLPIFRREVISIFEPMQDVANKLRVIKPYVLWSTPSAIQLLAQELEQQNAKLDIPLLLLMAETISEDQLELFKARICRNILDAYGCMEAPSMGFSYNRVDHKKLLPSATLVEVINHREWDKQQVGDIIITNLVNKTMPFVRFDLGDFVEILDEDQFPNQRIGRIHGRYEDIITLSDGKTLSFHQTYQLFHNFHQCEQYKFLQNRAGELILQLKVKKDADKNEIKQKVQERWNQKFNGCDLKIEWIDHFPIDPRSGKFKVIENLRQQKNVPQQHK